LAPPVTSTMCWEKEKRDEARRSVSEVMFAGWYELVN